jgi:phosphoenolpyruvate---glycerone phosphotransferase subunit DhaL
MGYTMSLDVLNASDVANILTRSAEDLRGVANELNALDTAIGDGDHGSSVATLFETAVADTDLENPSAGHLMKNFGQALMRHASGASGTLYAVLFTNIGTTLEPNDAIELSELARGFRRGLDMVQQVGGASLGDATLVDSLEPFVQVLEEQSHETVRMSKALDLAADAAVRGALSTSTMMARIGRARNFGDRSIGHEDPGARSFVVVANAWRSPS